MDPLPRFFRNINVIQLVFPVKHYRVSIYFIKIKANSICSAYVQRWIVSALKIRIFSSSHCLETAI